MTETGSAAPPVTDGRIYDFAYENYGPELAARVYIRVAA